MGISVKKETYMRTAIEKRVRYGNLAIILLVVVVLFFGGMGCGREGLPLPDFKDEDVHLTLLHTSDIHSRILSYHLTPLRTDVMLGLDPKAKSVGGIARIATVLENERKKSNRVIHLDAGDLFQGAPIFNVYKGRPELETLSALGLDAYVLGNHDFDNGGLVLAQQLSLWSALPMLASNYIYMVNSRHETPDMLRKLTQPYIILNIKGYRIGVIGLANTSSMTSLREGGNSLGILPKEPNTTLQQYVDLIKNKVELVIALTHLGLTEDQRLMSGYFRNVKIKRVNEHGQNIYERKWINGVCDLDIIVGGHHHVVLNPPKLLVESEHCQKRRGDHKKREVLLVHSGAFSKYVGRLDLVIRNKEIVSHRYQPIPITDKIKENAVVMKVLEKYILGLNREIDTTRVFAYAPVLVPRFGRGTGDSALGNLVTTSMMERRRVEADFALTNSLGIRTDLQAGPVSIEQFYEIFPFENTLTTLYISGREVKEMLDFVTERSSGRGCQSQAQVAGISFIMNCAKRKAEAVCIGSQRNPRCKKSEPNSQSCFDPIAKDGQRACLYGKSISDFSVYKLAANDYIARGGSGFKVLQRNTTQYNTGLSLRDALIEYIESLVTCKEVNKRRVKAKMEPYEIPEKFLNLPCIVGAEDGRIRRRLQ